MQADSFKCRRPIHMRDPSGKVPYIIMPCRNCLPCRAKRTAEWQTRLIWEAAHHEGTPPFFLTLTYAGEKEIVYDDVQKFLKRLRTSEGKFRYAVVCERGKARGRKHYHGIVYPMFSLLDLDLPARRRRKSRLEETWGKGFIDVRRIHGGSFRYFTKYLVKTAEDGNAAFRIRCSKLPYLGRAGLDTYRRIVEDRVDAGYIHFAEQVPYFQWTRLVGVAEFKNWIPADDRRRLIADLGVPNRGNRIETLTRGLYGGPKWLGRLEESLVS